MQCDPNLERMFNFFEHFVFEIGVDSSDDNGKRRKFKPTTAMQLLYDQLNEHE